MINSKYFRKQNTYSLIICVTVIIALCLIFGAGCSIGTDDEDIEVSDLEADDQVGIMEYSGDKEGEYVTPEFNDSAFNDEKADDYGQVRLDISSVNLGYFGIEVSSDNSLKLQVIKGDDTYTYDINSEMNPEIIPLNMGNGKYEIKVMEAIGEQKYAKLWSDTINVELDTKYSAFLRPSKMVNYNQDSQCVKLGQEIANASDSDLELVSNAYEYLCEAISYDNNKAASVTSGYIPDPDATLEERKGICFDYAALSAAIFRSQGIPCQLITGYVTSENVYHAWNKVYIKSEGWVTVEISADANDWQRIDITFAASGIDEELGEDNEYTQLYVY